MFLRCAIVGGLALVASVAHATPGVEPEEVRAADRAWQKANASLRTTERAQKSLEDRIARLKRENARNRRPTSPELEAHLVRSVTAERKLSQLRNREAQAWRRLADVAQQRIRRVDRQIRALVPKLKTGPLAERRRAARTIRGLTTERDTLRGRLSRRTSQESDRRTWAEYEVEIEPLDGPAELNDKADFVEDTRDKLAKKRQALAVLIREARQEREVARAAQAFARDVRLFDEESRGTRVGRSGSGPTARQNVADDAPEADAPLAAPPGAGFDNENPGNRGGEDPTTSPPPPSTPAPSSPVTPVFPREISPDVLINLRVGDLADNPEIDLTTLRRLERELAQLDGFLRKRARKIRSRAKELEHSEGMKRR